MTHPAESEAARLWNAGRQIAARTLLATAAATTPDSPSLFLALGRAHLGLLEFTAADDCFAKALALTPENANTRFRAAGLLFRMSGQAEKAHDILAPILQTNSPAPHPESAALHLELLDRLGQTDAALALAEECRKAGIHSPGLALQHARLLAHSRTDQALDLLHAALSGTDAKTPPHDQIRLKYELARTLDRLGDFDAAWNALREAHATYRRHLPPAFTPDLRRRALERTRQLPCPPAFSGGDPTPRIIHLGGFPRSGTTLLQRLLIERCPELTVLDEKEVLPTAWKNFKERANRSPDSADFHRLAADYTAISAEVSGHPNPSVILDKNPGTADLLALFHATCADFRVIQATRDTRDVLLSGLFTYLHPNASTAAFLDPLELARLIRAHDQLFTHYRETLPLIVHEARYEDVVQAPDRHAEELLHFAGLSPAATPVKAPLRFDSPTYAEARNPVTSSRKNRWRNYHGHLARAFDLLDA